MEAAYSSCDSLNYIGEQKWCCKLFDTDTSNVYNNNNEVTSTLKVSRTDCIDLPTSNRPGQEPSTEFNGVTGKGVLLWLPPGLEVSSKGNLDLFCSDTQHASIARNVFLNICPAGQDETRLVLDNGRGQVEKKCLVNLIGASELGYNNSDRNLQDELVTVVDLSVIPALIARVETQEDVNYMCQKIIDHFRTTLSSGFGDHPTNHNYYIVYNVISRENRRINNPLVTYQYASESPKKSPKNRKAGKKSKRDSTVFGNEKKSKFTFDVLIGSQTKILGYQNFNCKALHTTATELTENEENCLASATKNVSKYKSIIVEVDLFGIEIPSGLKVDVSSSFLTVNYASGIFNTNIKLKLPQCYKFPEIKNVPYHCNDGRMIFNIKVQNFESTNNKKLLHHSASVDSGIGSDDFCQNALSSILPEMIELDELADDDGTGDVSPTWSQADSTNESMRSTLHRDEHLLHNLEAENSRGKVEEKSGQNCNQNRLICDRISVKNLPTCVGTLLPTYEVSQTESAIYLNVMCGVGIEIASLQVCQISPYLISVSYTNTGACSTPLRFCIHVSTIDIEQENGTSEKSKEQCQSFKYERDEQSKKDGNSLLKGVHLLESTLVVCIEKSNASFWEALWAGHNGNLKKSIIKKEENHLQLNQVPEPRRLADQSSGDDASTGATSTPGDDGTDIQSCPHGADETEAGGKSKASRGETGSSDVLPKSRENSGRKSNKGSKQQQQGQTGSTPPREEGGLECGVSEILEGDEGKTSSSPPSNVNVNAKKKFGEVMLAASKNGNDKLRTKQGSASAATGGSAASCAHTNDSSKPNFNGTSSSNNKKKNNKAVKNSVSPVDDKENQACFGEENEEEDEVFESKGHQGADTEGSGASFPSMNGGGPRSLSSGWPVHEGKRPRRSSECIGSTTRKTSGRGSKDRSSPPLSGCRPRGILKRRGRSLSESHVGSLEECLGEKLLGKYGSVERALVGEYGCLERLIKECGWDEEDEDYDDDDESKGGDEAGSSGGKKSVRFSDVEKCHLFMSKASIVNQLANDDKKAMRMKMKEHKKKIRLEKRQAQKSGHSYSSGSNSSSYRDNNGYNSFDDDATTEESDGAELISTSSGGDTTDNTEDESEAPTRSTIAELNRALLVDRTRKGGKKRGGGKKNNKKKRVELTNNMIFQLDIEA